MIISFTNAQLQAIIAAASVLSNPDDRSSFLELVADQLRIKDVDIADAVRRARLFFQARGVVASDAGPY